jgi:hypothetical protein
VVGHSKTIIVWLLGLLLFATTVRTNSVLGFVIAMAGVVWYTQLRMNEGSAKPAATAAAPAGPPASVPGGVSSTPPPAYLDKDGADVPSKVRTLWQRSYRRH